MKSSLEKGLGPEPHGSSRPLEAFVDPSRLVLTNPIQAIRASNEMITEVKPLRAVSGQQTLSSTQRGGVRPPAS